MLLQRNYITLVNMLCDCNRLQPIHVLHWAAHIACLTHSLENVWTALINFWSKVLLILKLGQWAIPNHLPGQIQAQASVLFEYIYIWLKICKCKLINSNVKCRWGTTILAPLTCTLLPGILLAGKKNHTESPVYLQSHCFQCILLSETKLS